MPFSDPSLNIWQILKLLTKKFISDRCTTYASALAFSSMLSIVPFLAILFAILKLLNIHNTLAPIILSNVAAGSHELINRILVYISNTKVGSLGAIGLIALLVSVMGTLDHIEDAFNQIWGQRSKAVHHKLRDYLILIFSIPLLITVTVTTTTALQHQVVIQWFLALPGFGPILLLMFHLVPWLIIWLAFGCLYLFMPNKRVRVKPAVIGAILAGSAWQLAQWGYVHFQIGVSRYNTIYGTLALLPVFMVWIYISWVIILAGMEVVWFLQTRSGDSTKTF